MSGHLKAAIAYAVVCAALIAIGFGNLDEWQMAVRNGALIAATMIILLIPQKVTK